MAVRCFNRNDPAYKNLVNVLDSPLVTDSLIEGYQSLHKLSEDVFPTVPEALEYVDMKAVSFSLKQRTFGKALFGNLSRNKWVYKLKDKYYVNTIAGAGYMGIEDSKKAVRNNIKRIERYLDYNNISSEALEFIPTKNWKKKSNGTYEIKIKTGLFTKQDVLKKSRGTDTTHTTKIINHLGKMFPEVKIRIATLEEAEEHYNGLPEWQKKDLPFEEVKSYFVNNEVVLIKERITTETAIEEVLHPFIDAVHVDNQPLFKGLLSEAKKNFPILNQQIQDSYSDLKGFDKTDRELELVTQALSRHFKKEYEGTPTLTWKQKVIELLNWLKRIINDLHIYITGKGIPVSAIRSTYAEPVPADLIESIVTPAGIKTIDYRTMTADKKAAAVEGNTEAQKEWMQEEISEFYEAIEGKNIDDISEETLGLFRTAQQFPDTVSMLTPYLRDLRTVLDNIDKAVQYKKFKKKKDDKGQAQDMTYESLFSFIENIFKAIRQPGTTFSDSPGFGPPIKTSTTLSDVAKLLNTEGLSFKLENKVKDSKVRYHLSKEKQDTLNYAFAGGNDIQKKMGARMFHLSQISTKEIDSLTVSLSDDSGNNPLVEMDEDHRYFDKSTQEGKPIEYTSTTLAIKGEFKDKEDKKLNLDLGNDFDIIAESIAMGKTFDDIKDRMVVLDEILGERAYANLMGTIMTLKAQHYVILPQVIFFDPVVKIAGTADLVVISPDGKLGIIDIKSGKAPVGSAAYDTDPYSLSEGSILGAKWKEKHEGQELKLSTKEQYGVQIGVYRRMAENMGYELMDSDILGAYAAFHFNVDIKGRGKQQEFEKFRYGEWVRYEDTQNDVYINMLVPSDINQEAYDAIQAEFAEVGEDDFINSENYFTGDEGLPEDVESGSQFDVIYERLDSYNLGLINHTELIEKLRLDIFTDRSKKEILDGISKTSTAIVNSFTGGFEKVSEIYTDVLLNSIKEIKSFREYVKNPDNIKKPEYITHVLNFSTFAESYRGLHTVGKTAELGKYQMKLVNELTYQLNLVVGEPDRTNELGVIDQAIYDYVEALVKGTTTRKNWSDEEVKQMLHKVRDMDVMEYYTYDTAGATDPLLQIMDKLKKRAQLEVMDKVEERNEAIRGPAIKLRKLSKGNKVDYSFAMQIGADGKWNGQYTQELGYDYHKMKQDVYDGIYDEEGQPLVYVDINDLANARPEDIAHNKKVKKAKEKMNAFFMAEERGTSGKPIDGEYHKYTKEFKDERAKYEEWIDTGDWGHWRRRPGVHTDYAWLSYRARWYESKKTYIGSYDSNDNFTGQVTLTSKSYPKVKARIARTITRPSKEYPKGRDMTDPKWRKIMSPTTTLEEAQKEWFLMFKKHYEEDLLKKLPQGVRGNTLGKAPLVFNNLGDRLKTKGPLITSLWANMTKGVKDWWNTTGSSKAVMTDSFGNFIDTVPVYYVGNPRSDKALKSIDKKIAALDKDYGLGKIKLGVFENDKQALKNRRAKIMAMPTTEEISTDLTDSLLRFSAMAENYEMMSAIEDTLKSIVKVIEKREYTPSGGTKLFGKVEGVAREIGMRGTGTQGEALTVRRAKEFMHLQFYDNKEKTRNWWDKTVSGLIRYSSLSYVAFNPFGNLNNFTIGVINNSIELAGQRFFKRKSYVRATKEFYNRAIPDIIRATAYSYSSKAYDKYRPQSKFEAMVAYIRMMDKKMDIRELEGLQGKESWLDRKMNFGYIVNDAAEYNVQTTIGVTLLIDQMIKNSKTGATLALYDAYTHHGNGDVTMKEGFDMLIDDEGNDIKSWNEGVPRYDMRIKIREVNKHIHGNYAKEDRMVIQQYTLGKLGAQFHKWVIPAIKARYRREYFDENLGWLEGRYLSAFNFLHYSLKHMGEIGKWTTNYKEQIKDPERATMKMKNVWRTAMEFQFFATTWLMSLLLANLFEDDDDQSETIKRLENVAIYTFGRAQDEMVVFAPWMPPFEGAEVMYQMFKSPIASTRTMGELAEAFDSTLTWGWGNFLLASGQITRGEFRTNKDLVYQRGIYKGRLKVAKQWADAVPILYGIQRWASFKNQKDFHIK